MLKMKPPLLPSTAVRHLSRFQTQHRTLSQRLLHNTSKDLPTRTRSSIKRNAFMPNLACRRASYKDSTGSFMGNTRLLFRHHPFSMVTVTIVTLVYVNWYYQAHIVGDYVAFPEEVAKKLRRASYYTVVDFQPREAIKYYKQAIAIANELRMDAFSNEVMGIKIRIAELAEKAHNFDKAVEILERIRSDNMRWLEEWKDHTEFHNKPEWRKKRTQILAKTIAISVKLGELYTSGEIWDRDSGLARMIWAVEAALAESQRRTLSSATDESDGEWLSNEEMGGALESLAHRYEARNQHYLATPLFLQALSLKKENDCHSVVLMNNVASSLAQQSPQAARAAQAYAESRSKSIVSSDAPSGPVASRETMIENAQAWAENALKMARDLQPPVRNEECDVGCAVATHNLGEFAEMLNNIAEAERRYKEAISLSRAIGFQDGIDNSSARLRALLEKGG